MKCFKNAKIIFPGHALHGQRRDICLSEDRKIKQIAPIDTIALSGDIVESNDLCVSPGWVDAWAQVGEPGLEYRETFETAAAAAHRGGYTHVCVLPNTKPAIDAQAQVRMIANAGKDLGVVFLPLGAVSSGCDGKDMAELLDMQRSGAVAFTDGKQTIFDAGLLLRTLQYLAPINGLVMNQPMDKYLSQGGLMHEGICSTTLGMKGIPSLAEELAVRRDLEILQFAGGRLHFANISTAGTVTLIREAKANGLKVTASVSPMHLCFTDEMLSDFDVNYKIMPPLRSENDRHALLAGVIDGTIDVINSQHIPLDTEQIMCEFPYAGFGVTMLETAFSLCQTRLSKVISPEIWVEKASMAPRKLLGLERPSLEVGALADLTFFDPTQTWVYEKPLSKSINSPLLGQTLTGKVY